MPKVFLLLFYAQLIECVVNKIEFKSPIRNGFRKQPILCGNQQDLLIFANKYNFTIEFVQQWGASNPTAGWKPIPILCFVYLVYLSHNVQAIASFEMDVKLYKVHTVLPILSSNVSSISVSSLTLFIC